MSHQQNPPQGPGYGQQPGQQPGEGRPPYGGQPGQPGPPPQAQPPYPQQGQPPYPPPGQVQQGPPGQGQPPYRQQGQPPYPPQGQPRPGQPPYPQQGQPQYPQQGQPPYPQQGPGYPPQGPPGQYGPGQYAPAGQPGPWGSGGPQGPQAWGPGPQGRQTRKGGNQIIFLAAGCIAMVAVIGVALALVFGRSDDPGTADPDPLPTGGPSTPSENGTDEGIDAGNGIFVKPATGFIRKSGSDVKGVYLVKQGQGTFWLQVAKGKPGESGATILPRLMNSQKTAMTSGTFETGERKETKPEGESNVSLVTTQSWSGSVTTQNGTTQLAGFVAIVDNKSGVISAVQVTTRKELASELSADIDAMMQSVVRSQ